MQERLESVLEGPFNNNLASKRPKLSYSASSLAEDKKNFLYTLMGEVLQQGHRVAGRIQLHWANMKFQSSTQGCLLEQAQGRSRCQSTSRGTSRRYLQPIHCSEGFKQAAAAC